MYSLPPLPITENVRQLCGWLQQALWEMVRDSNSGQLTALMQQPTICYGALFVGVAVNGAVAFSKGNNVQTITRTAVGVYRVRIYGFEYRQNLWLDLASDISSIPQGTDVRRFAEIEKVDPDEFDFKLYRQYYLPNDKLQTDPWDPVGVTINMLGLSRLYDGAIDLVNIP